MPLGLDQELMRMLMDTFAIELDEQLQTITDGLLVLEKGIEDSERRQTLESVFRAAHNIKGAARGVEVTNIADIAHHLESIFAVLKRENRNPDGAATDLVLESLDAMRQAMVAFGSQQSLGFDKNALIARLESVAVEPAVPVNEAIQDQPVVPPVAVVHAPPHPQPIANAGAGTEADRSVEISKPAAGSQHHATDVVRVNVDKLENLAAMMEELQVAKIGMDDHLVSMQQLRNRVQELTSGWSRAMVKTSQADRDGWLKRSADTVAELDIASARAHREMRSSTSRLGILVESLQDSVRMMRLVPVATLLRPMSRSVRDIARELGKKVNFEISGDDIEIDRMVLDGIHDPLVHLLRNALDHGIEAPQQRLNKGKPAEGRLHISVSSEGSQIVMTVQDDGNGISVDEIAASARKKKLVSEAELAAMGRDEILDLIFRPGFSSKDIITRISGRGVGLDVVVMNLRKLKGSVQVQTDQGLGTRFVLRLPITLATDHGVLVRAGGAVFAIPTSAVDRIMEIRPEQIIEVEASHAILYRGRSIPLRDLAATLELETQERINKKILPVMVVAKGWDSVAFLVDEVIGEREIVVKPFRSLLQTVRNITGGTLTGNGEVIMVLNPSDLVDSAMHGSLAHLHHVESRVEVEKVLRVLVVDDSITTRSLEKSILEHAGYKVSLAVDGKQAWDMLQEQAFDLVVTDVEMPKMDGFELTALIKQSERLKRLPVIIVTSLAREEDRKLGIEVGAEAYIVKGQFETKVLLDVVGQLI
ncbi:MAG: hybrid sensor histidine kinase/response regulator [Gallionella sp.]|nr:hybrid sensor histidine kinase/response regulator [Gallionella sp.]